MSKKTIWITGASSGIGEAAAYYYNAEGYQVILSARNGDKLQQVRAQSTHPESCFVLPLDLTDISSFEQPKRIPTNSIATKNKFVCFVICLVCLGFVRPFNCQFSLVPFSEKHRPDRWVFL
mgnify:CR=1 FL=1